MPVMRALKRGRGGMGTGKHNLPRQHVMSVFQSHGFCKQDTAPARHVLLHMNLFMLFHMHLFLFFAFIFTFGTLPPAESAPGSA